MKRQSPKNQLLTFNDNNNIKVIYFFLDEVSYIIQIENSPTLESVEEIKTQIKEKLISGFESNKESFLQQCKLMKMSKKLLAENAQIQQDNIDFWKNGVIDIFRIDSSSDNDSKKGPIYSLFKVENGVPQLTFQIGPINTLGLF